MAIVEYRPLELMLNSKITKHECDDFIAIWENFVPAAFCDKIIEYYETLFDETGCYIEQESETNLYAEYANTVQDGEQLYKGNLRRKDTSVMLNYVNSGLTYQINQFLKSCALHYIHDFSQLNSVALMSSDIKMQKTPPGGGYHIWHYEAGSYTHSHREVVWMIYLNDLPDGEGETEFLYQKRRIKPTKGTVVFFPAGMTHVHKGNTVFTQDKYILTGWYIKAGNQ